MKTKHEICIYFNLCTCGEEYKSRDLVAPDCPWHSQCVSEAMDEYMEQTCLELLTYMAQKGIICGKSDSGEDVFMVRSERGDISRLTKEELFKNFL